MSGTRYPNVPPPSYEEVVNEANTASETPATVPSEDEKRKFDMFLDAQDDMFEAIEARKAGLISTYQFEKEYFTLYERQRELFGESFIDAFVRRYKNQYYLAWLRGTRARGPGAIFNKTEVVTRLLEDLHRY